jgi:maltose/moltooligosaccharide transporter
VANVAPDGGIPDTVKYAFYAGGAVLLGAVLWTILRTREYPPAQLQSFSDNLADKPAVDASRAWRMGLVLLVVGGLVLFAIGHFALEKEVYVLAGGLIVFGLLFVWLSFARGHGMLREVMGDLYGMPTSMRRLAWVQLFSWFALFAMWIYTTSGVTETIYGTTDVGSALYNEGANWVGVLFAAYNGFAAVAAVVIPLMVRRWGLRISHLVNLCLGGAGLLSFLVIRDPQWLLASMVGVGFAWASILSLPYALLSDNLPAAKMGVYMGIFNFFIVIPQLLAASVLGLLLRLCFHNQPIWALALGGACLLIAGLFTLRVREPETHIS